MKRPAQASLMRVSRKLTDRTAYKALYNLARGNEAVGWALWKSYCGFRRKFGFSIFNAYATMEGDYNFTVNGELKRWIEKQASS